MEELFKARKEKLNLFKSIRNKMQDKKRIDVPDGLYTKCDSCGESILSEDLKESYYVCPKCGAHLKMRAYTRLNLLYDGGKYKELYKSIKSNDPLMFPGYKEKLVKLEETTNLDEAVVFFCGHGSTPVWSASGRSNGNRASVGLIEGPDEVTELLHAFHRDGVVDGGPHAAHFAVPLQIDEAGFGRLLDELGVQLLTGGAESDVHIGAEGRR